MIKTILMKIGKFLLIQGANFLYNAVDKDKDGKLSKDEINDAVDKVRQVLTKIKNKKVY